MDCLTGTIDPITLSDFRRLGFAVFKPGHLCKQEDLEIRKRRAEKKLYVDVVKKWDELRLLRFDILQISSINGLVRIKTYTGRLLKKGT